MDNIFSKRLYEFPKKLKLICFLTVFNIIFLERFLRKHPLYSRGGMKQLASIYNNYEIKGSSFLEEV